MSMRKKHSRTSFPFRLARVVVGLAVVVTVSGAVAVAAARAADENKPAAEHAVADRYVIVVSGMT